MRPGKNISEGNMKKITILFLLLLSILSSGCVFTFLGRAAGTIVRLPFEATGEILHGFGEGLFDTDTDTPTPPKKEEKKTPYRDSEENIRWK